MSTTHQVIYIAEHPSQAHLLRNLLAEHDIEAFVINDTLNSVHFQPSDWLVRAAGGPGFLPTAPRVLVDEADAERARAIAMQVDADLRSGTMSADLAQLDEEAGDDDDWPKCPHCSRPRLCTCPVCRTSAAHFPEAFMPDREAGGAAGDERLVICPTCDEAFAPRFPARCEWCGYRFADGIEPAATNLYVTPPVFRVTEWNGRAMIVVAGMLGAIGAVAGWFYYVLR
jgi:Putative prokaryotic signal transducing protein